MTVRPRRSVLYMPGSNARALEKARELPADGLILDLEDAVAPEAKAQAREAIAKALQKGGFGDREVMVRINGLDTRWWVDDLTAVAAAKPDAVLVPKMSDPGQLQDLAARIVDMGTDPQRTGLGDDGDAAGDAQCRRDRRRGARFRDPALRLRHGHQRSRQGHARPPRARPRADAAVADELRRRRARLWPRHPRRRL